MGVSDGNVDNYQRNLYTKTETAYRIDTVPGNTGKVYQRKLYTRTERINRTDTVPESIGLCKDKRYR